MKTEYSKSWVESVQPRKQRKYVYKAPKHIKRKLLSCMLSKELKLKLGVKTLGVRKGDIVKVMRGAHKGKDGRVSDTDAKKVRVFVEKIEISKKDGNKIPCPLHPSNLVIIEISSQDKRRVKKSSSDEKKATVKGAVEAK